MLNDLIQVFRPWLRVVLVNFPTPIEVLMWAPPFLAWSYACIYVAGFLKRSQTLTTPHTRKICHFLIFVTAATIHIVWGFRIVCVFGAVASLVIFYSVIRGDGHILYEAIARETDAPHRSYYIIVPYFATVVGGVVSNALAGEMAIIGDLVTGLGDAAGEPIGTRFGKHRYRVPSVGDVVCTRSYEGSTAVFLVSLISISVVAALSVGPSLDLYAVCSLIALALISTIVEAVSPHGWDNATMQILPSVCASRLLAGI
jgi:phytol kinase